MQSWRNWEKFPTRIGNDLPGSPKVVKAVFNFSKHFFPQYDPLAQRVHFWQRCRTVVAKSPKVFPSNPKKFETSKKISHQMFFLELIVWHVDCSFGNPSEKFKRKMKLSQSKYKKDKKICTIFKKNWSSKCRLDTQVQFRQLCRCFPARIQEIFHSNPELI